MSDQPAVSCLEQSISLFLRDPPDSDFQRGFLAALLVIYDEVLGKPDAGLFTDANSVLERATRDHRKDRLALMRAKADALPPDKGRG